jgi:hypothetical protein
MMAVEGEGDLAWRSDAYDSSKPRQLAGSIQVLAGPTHRVYREA